MSKRAPSLLEVCVLRAGFRKGGRVAQFIVEWAICEAELGPDIGIEDFAGWWKDSRSSAYRRMHEFRAVFPEERTPHRLASLLPAGRPKVSDLAAVPA